jgi:TPR repeat protein
MSDNILNADLYYAEAMKYDWRQESSPAAATLARVAFNQAASMGHAQAISALAHMTFDGSGGEQDRELALILLWSSFRRGNYIALQELVDMLESYAEISPESQLGKSSEETAKQVEEICQKLILVEHFIDKLKLQKSIKN